MVKHCPGSEAENRGRLWTLRSRHVSNLVEHCQENKGENKYWSSWSRVSSEGGTGKGARWSDSILRPSMGSIWGVTPFTSHHMYCRGWQVPKGLSSEASFRNTKLFHQLFHSSWWFQYTFISLRCSHLSFHRENRSHLMEISPVLHTTSTKWPVSTLTSFSWLFWWKRYPTSCLRVIPSPGFWIKHLPVLSRNLLLYLINT